MANEKQRLEDIMQTEVVTLAPNDHLDLAEDVMKLGRIRHLPVVDAGRLVGIVTNRDLLAASLSGALDFEATQRRTFLRSIDVGEVMTRDPVTLPPSATLYEAAELMLSRKLGCVPIVDGDIFRGLVTETDLLRAALLGKGAEDVEPEGSQRFEKELEELRRLRDELRVQIHLGAAEAKDLWERLEQRYGELETKAKRLTQRAGESLEDARKAADRLAEEIRDGYRRLRDLL